MSLRVRLFLVFGGLVALLVLAQWWWVRTLTRELSEELEVTAIGVGMQVADVFVGEHDCANAPCRKFMTHAVKVIRDGPHREPVVIPVRKEHRHESMIRRFPVSDDNAQAADAGAAEHDENECEVLVETVDSAAPHAETRDEVHQDDAGAQPTYRFMIKTKVDQVSDEDELPSGLAEVLLHEETDVHVLSMVGPELTHHIPIPQGFRDRLERFSQRLLLGSLGLLGVGLLLAAVVAHRVTAPLRRLSGAATRVGQGKLGTQVAVAASGEVGQAITAFNRMSGQLAELDAKARALSARQHLGEIGEIARGLAHTLRNPLNALGLSVEELAAKAASGGQELADSARRQIRRIDHSIRSFLALASQGSGATTEVAVEELVQDVALEALQDGRGRVRLDLDVEPELRPLAAVEPELRAVLQALVVNAVEASPEGGTVRIRVRPEGQGLRLEIVDQGPGLPPEIRERLFTPHLSTKADGSGMGLFLAHRIATTRYGGTLELTDEAEGGTRAVLEIGPRTQELTDEQ
ncbi:MAG: HAMP domain-containing histidine kinase [bacterium]|nr:HAMP domain-containing histidine kinase [bacterium]